MITNSETFLFQDKSISLLTYYIESNGEAVVIDPMRDYEPYLKFMKERNAKLKYILLTHIPSDYVSGALDLSRETEAPILMGTQGYLQYDYVTVADDESICFGSCSIQVIYTPGHTLESTCYLLLNGSGVPHSIYTGDTVLVNSVCFPDLALLRDNSERELGLMFYESLGKLKALPDDVLLYPGHTAGNIAVKRVSEENINSTIGNEKENNPFFKHDDPEVFIKSLVGLRVEIKNRPFLLNIARINIEGYEPLNESLARLNKQISPEIADRMSKSDCTVLDARDRSKYSAGVIKGSITVPLKENFCIWAGTLIRFNERFVVLYEPEKEEEALKMLLKIGMYNVEGFISGGADKWVQFGLPLMKLQVIPSEEVFNYIYDSEYTLLDVREEIEYEQGILPYSLYFPLSKLKAGLCDVPKDVNLYVFCKSGGRAIMAYSYLKRDGFDNIFILEDGLENLEKFNIPLVMK
jgi:hydroxyacylglutathione hydrolase